MASHGPTAGDDRAIAGADGRRRGAGVHAAGVGAVLFIVTASVNLQVPLYPAYAAAAGLGTGPTALMFGAYVAGLLPVLVGLGGASDRLGRRPVLTAGVALSCLATLLVILRPEFSTLVAARLVQGMGMGLTAGTGTAYLAELPGMDTPERAAGYAAVTTSLGSGAGALFTAAALLAGPTLRPASYPALLAALVACLGLLWMMPRERRAAGDGRERVPVLRLPSYPAGSLAPALAIAGAWAVTGLVFVVVPAQLARGEMGAWSAPALFLVNVSGASCQPWARRMGARRALRTGLWVLPAGYALLLAGTALARVPLLLAGAAVVGGACYGFTFLGGLAEATRLGGANRARTVAGFLLFAYLGFSLAPAGVGFLADAIGVVPALAAFGAALLLAHAALLWRHARADA
ncbi:MFS transporter [Longimicrobium sp.]|uniref:MFS transporter n=1 Tax=Longimicrobium sp. TaxID=2029185 RepID=UPI002E381C1B|nr:MFS transporter [Longimicrobium sp.]HEX6036396.1 MFS transporter [Longimicrobium sp.]